MLPILDLDFNNELPNLKIYYCDMPIDFLTYDYDNFFTKLLSLKYNVLIDKNNPDILFYSNYGFEHLNINAKYRIFLKDIDLNIDNNYDLAFINTDNEDERHIYLPKHLCYIFENDLFSKLLMKDKNYQAKNFCSIFIDYQSNTSSYRTQIQLYKLLSLYKPILFFSTDSNLSRYNSPEITDFLKQYGTNLSLREIKRKILKEFKPKFHIVVDDDLNGNSNLNLDFIDAMVANAIPIYYGQNITNLKYFNNSSFINLNLFSNFENGLNYIKLLDKYYNRYFILLQQDWINEEQLEYYRFDKYLKIFEDLLSNKFNLQELRSKYNYSSNSTQDLQEQINQNTVINQAQNQGFIDKQFEFYPAIDYKIFLDKYNPNAYFDDIYCLNLNRRPDRWIKFYEKIKKLQLFVTRIEGFDSKDEEISNEYQQFSKRYTLHSTLTLNAYAIKKGHLKIFLNAIQRDLNKILILEDDILFHINFLELFEQSVRSLEMDNIDWNVWFLGHTKHPNHSFKKINEYFSYANQIVGFFGIAFNVKFLKDNYEIFEKGLEAIDMTLRFKFEGEELSITNKIISSNIPLIGHSNDYSDNLDTKIILPNVDLENYF